jgi:hypothetical protein
MLGFIQDHGPDRLQASLFFKEAICPAEITLFYRGNGQKSAPSVNRSLTIVMSV